MTTPRPWRVEEVGAEEFTRGDAELIVKAVNSYEAHQKLAVAARKACGWLPRNNPIAEAVYQDLMAAWRAVEEVSR